MLTGETGDDVRYHETEHEIDQRRDGNLALPYSPNRCDQNGCRTQSNGN
jgi:hypothetical protein